MSFDNQYLERMAGPATKALEAMELLEGGAVANPDEERMVGHYWLRNPSLAPSKDISGSIEECLTGLKTFARDVRSGKLLSPSGKAFRSLLVIGIGGSALGPQFVNQALRGRSCSDGHPELGAWFFDNTDPDGMALTLSDIPDLATTLCIVISKSGGTKETRNGLLVAQHAYEELGLNFASSAVAITGEYSQLDTRARDENWLSRFEMWSWVGGRTSELSAVGLVVAALQGFDIDSMLLGAREMDEWTRERDYLKNPASILALSWYHAGCGKGNRAMVVLPYNDRLLLFSRYLQQLVMESLGKEKDLDGNIVQQGLAVYGNKGSTDQHAYVQQLRDGRPDFFATFIEVLRDGSEKEKSIAPSFRPAELQVDKGITAGDYLSGFYQGTRRALSENKRESVTITVPEVNAYAVGQLIALFERTVGLYASFINVNAYHQPGVEAGKKAAGEVIEIQKTVQSFLLSESEARSVDEIVAGAKLEGKEETVFKILQHLEANDRVVRKAGESIWLDKYTGRT